MKILFIGSSAPLSLIPLEKILHAGHTICAVAMEASQANPFYHHLFPVQTDSATPDNIHLDSFAKQNNLPVIILAENLQKNIVDIKHYSPDIILISCFGKKIPDAILSIPIYGSFNLHPSMLPKFRGPTPVFWQFKYAASPFGVSLHRMTHDFDCGDIIKQAHVKFDDGIHHLQAKLQLAHSAADLILDTLNDFSNLIKHATPQPSHASSYYTYPTQSDYKISPQWSARRLFNFIRAYQDGRTLFPCEINGQTFNLLTAISYQLTSLHSVEIMDNIINLPCADGSLRAELSL